ncbi:MAG: hypothetical protein Q8L48_44450 [Archangium sp.]|nr:hypothetical protein [Archangium sp.]
MKSSVLWCGSLAVALCACEPNLGGQSSEPLGSLTCDAGLVAFNFTKFPSARSSEALSRATDAGPAPFRLKPNLVSIVSGSCGGTTDWTDLFREACEGQTSCAFQRTDCAGAVRVTYACSNTPSTTKSLICNVPLYLCIFQMDCPRELSLEQTILASQAPQDRIECVPENCHGATRRDENMQCVADRTKPIERSWGYNEAAGEGERMAVSIDTWDLRLVYPSLRTRQTSNFVRRLDIDTSSIDYFSYDGAESFFAAATENSLAGYRTLLSEALYDMKATVYYPVKPGTENKGMQGAISLWIHDEYKVGGNVEKAFRCLMHTVDMAKYGPGTLVEYTPNPINGFKPSSNLYKIEINERFIVPKDCREYGSTYLQSQAILARPRGLSAVDFSNSATHLRGQLTASYDLEGKTFLVDDFTDDITKIMCGVRPSDFFYSEQAQTHDRYRYYQQREIPLFLQDHAGGFPSYLESINGKLGPRGIFVQEANKTTLGLSSVRPKSLEYKIRMAGKARGYLRIDADWYLAGDRHGYWGKAGLKEHPMTLQTWLVPLDANDAPLPENLHLSLGEARVYKSTAYGETQSFRYAIDEAMRSKFVEPGGLFETSKAGKKFKFKTCLRVGGTSLSGPTGQPLTSLYTAQYSLEVSEANRCRITEAPFLVRADPAIAPLEPLGDEDLAESNPQGTGDGRMSQKQENDQDRDCVRVDGGVQVCRTSAAADQEGEGSFGGSVLATDNNGYAGDGDAHVDREAELAGFQVIDDEEAGAFDTPGAKLTFTISPDWDSIAAALDVSIPGFEFEGENFEGGVKGLTMGVEFKVPVRYGALQGTIVYGVSIGVGLAVTFEYTLTPSRPAGCTGMNDECDVLYNEVSAGSLNQVTQNCYAAGGRLADLRSQEESGFLRGKISSGKYWIGAQLAEEYANPACRLVWLEGVCQQSHITTMRWLSGDDDFATSTGRGAFTLDTNHLYQPTSSALTASAPGSGRPQFSGVVLSSSGTLEARPLAESYPAICKLRNAATVTSHELKAALEIVGAAGFSLAFCTPSEEFGVCIEGSLNVLEAKLIPSVSYSHSDFQDQAGRRGTQSSIKLSLDYEVSVLSGAVELKVVLGPWFTFTYNLFSFSGLKLPLGGNITEKEFPQKEDFQ